MSKPEAPKPPDPKETAAAQTGTNIATALANAALGQVNQVTPDGSLTYSQTGSMSVTDPSTGQSYVVPRYTATQTLSPNQQAIKDQTDQTQLGLARLAGDQTSRIAGLLSSPIDLSAIPAATDRSGVMAPNKDYSADRQMVEDALMARLNPSLERDREALRTQLSNQGLKQGTEAYSEGLAEFGRNANDARFGAILAAGDEQTRQAALDQQQFANQQYLLDAQDASRSRALSEQFAVRNQPINEITALLSGSQVSQPQFVNPAAPQIPTTDFAGLTANSHNAQMQRYQQQLANRQGTLGGLFSLGSAAILASDRRLKKDVEKVGTMQGMGIYKYRYKDEPDEAPTHIGLMAQEVAKRRPDAVVTRPDGYMAVDYDRIAGAA